jgi:aspartyl-tRNA(Asn)/glutamyl-tRNA(Gln) amidotransferase subunit A
VPVTVKENIGTKGDPAPIGVPIADMTPRAEDTPVPARLREAGCVILGKTTMPDYGMMSSGLSSLHGVTRNPWDLAKNPAGSSSARARRPPPATAPCISAPTSAAPSACRPPIAACSG